MKTDYDYDDGEEPCKCCGRVPKILACDFCGATGRIIDCGNLAQPRPIAATEDGQHVICEDCVDEHGANGPDTCNICHEILARYSCDMCGKLIHHGDKYNYTDNLRVCRACIEADNGTFTHPVTHDGHHGVCGHR